MVLFAPQNTHTAELALSQCTCPISQLSRIYKPPCCVQLVPSKWVCAPGGPRDAPLLIVSAGSARTPPQKNSVSNRDRSNRGFLPPLPQAGQCLIYGYKGSASLRGGVYFWPFWPHPDFAWRVQHRLFFYIAQSAGLAGTRRRCNLDNALSSGGFQAPGATKI